MTPEQILYIGGSFTLTLLGLCGFFLRRLLADHDLTKQELVHLKAQMAELKFSVEQNFVSLNTYQETVTRFMRNFEKIFEQLSAQTSILARLDERSKWEERFSQILDRVAPKRSK